MLVIRKHTVMKESTALSYNAAEHPIVLFDSSKDLGTFLLDSVPSFAFFNLAPKPIEVPTMLEPKQFYGVRDGPVSDHTWTRWTVVDWDQRRILTVKIEGEFEHDWNTVIGHLISSRHRLTPDTLCVEFSAGGDVRRVSSDAFDDKNVCVFRPPLDEAWLPADVRSISRAGLQEVARLDAAVDLVTCPYSRGPDEKVVFKYFFTSAYLNGCWKEMNILCRVKHPSIVPFDRVIRDELEGNFVGFTTKYIPGGTLAENQPRVFKLKWLQQLLQVTDYINFHLGFVHGDIAPNNIIIDASSDTLVLLDFDRARRVGTGGIQGTRYDTSAGRDMTDAARAVYQVITRDHDATFVDLGQADWQQHEEVTLDQPLAEFRRALFAWCERRRRIEARGEEGAAAGIRHPAGFFSLPDLPDPPLTPVLVRDLRRSENPWCEEMQKLYEWQRRDVVRQGKPVLNWQRLPSR